MKQSKKNKKKDKKKYIIEAKHKTFFYEKYDKTIKPYVIIY